MLIFFLLQESDGRRTPQPRDAAAMPEPTPLPTTELEAEAAGERLDVFVARRDARR